jgi:hypothetical protein
VLSSLMGCFPLSAMALGFSPLEQGGEDVKWWKSMRMGLSGTQGAILLTVIAHWEWWLVGVRYWNTKRRGFLPECEGFSLNSVYGSRIEDFPRILCQGQEFLRVRLKESSRIRSKKIVKFAFTSKRGSSQHKYRSWNFIIYYRRFKHP